MTVIREADVIASVAGRPAVHFLLPHAGFHPRHGPRLRPGTKPSARDAIAQILTNSRMCAEGHRPICQDTGHRGGVRQVGMGVRWDAQRDLEAMINEGVRRAYLNPDNKLRASIVADPAFKRGNTSDNTPAVIHTEFVAGDERRDHGRRERRRLGKQIHVRDAESVRFGRRLGVGNGAGDGRRLVPAGNAGRRALAAAPRRPCCWQRNR